MKKLSRDEMKKVMGGNNAPGCEGNQSTYICGTRINGNQCFTDICFCNGTPVLGGCDYPTPCNEMP
jgi:hypothetical protein